MDQKAQDILLDRVATSMAQLDRIEEGIEKVQKIIDEQRESVKRQRERWEETKKYILDSQE